jgi:hypothetical protein
MFGVGSLSNISSSKMPLSDLTPSPPQRLPGRAPRHLPNDEDFAWEEAELERLREALRFDTVFDVIAFVSQVFVLNPFTEFTNNFLAGSGGFTTPSLHDITEAITYDMNGNQVYLAAIPDTSNWNVVDHFARFIQRVYNGAQLADSSWAGVEEPDFAIVAWMLYELLVFLSRRWLTNYQ